MSKKLIRYRVKNYTTCKDVHYENLDISYEVFGAALHTAPIVLVNHALTGNSNVADEETGWWKTIVGQDKVINTNHYTVIAFNILGNGYDGTILENYKDFILKDVARLIVQVFDSLEIHQLFAAIGGSLGGGLAWEIAILRPNLIRFVIPIAADWKSTDWIIGHNYIQEQILNKSSTPLQEARMMAMLFYRTPASFTRRFNRTKTDNGEQFNVESWLSHHGKALEKRFELAAYKMMNHLLTTIDARLDGTSFEDSIRPIQSTIIQVAVDSDLFFVKAENVKTKQVLDRLNIPNEYHEIQSIHGHDAFLIEYEQLTGILQSVFMREKV